MGDAILGGLVTGGVTLIALWLTLRHQNQQAIRAEQGRIRERRVERLRDSYRVFVAAAFEMQGHAAMLPLAIAFDERGDSTLAEAIQSPRLPSSDLNASLSLEADADQRTLDLFGELSAEHTMFLATLGSYLDRGERMPAEEWTGMVQSMQDKAKAIAETARQRLAQLELPSKG